MPPPSRLRLAVDRRLFRIVQARARGRSALLRLLPESWLEPLLAPTVRRLRGWLLTAVLLSSVLAASAICWLMLQ